MSILQYGFMQRAFFVGILLAVITPCIGITIVLKRMSMIGDALSHGSLRLTLSEEITKEDVDFVVEQIKAIVDRLRSMSPLYEDYIKKQQGK